MKNNTKNSVLKSITAVLFAMMIASILVIGASANDVDNGTEAPEHPGPPAPQSPTWEQTIDNGDGTYTFTQQVDEVSTPPHYTSPVGYGFEEYSWYDEDYGWQHTFPSFNTANLQILSATLTIRAWDVDSEVWHGWDGEYDSVTADSVFLSPQYLQGNNQQWSVTTFTLPTAVITDDGNINIWLDIDMHHNQDWWATTVDYSKLTIVYTTIETDPPYQPTLSISPSPCVAANDDLVVTVTGPTPPDPDGDSVIYTYRWMVDTGTGFYVDDDFAGRGDHTGNSVTGTDTVVGDKWMVQVTPFDVHGVQGDYAEVFWSPIVLTCNIPPVADCNGPYEVDEGSSITLDGSASYDLDGSIVSYEWDYDHDGTFVADAVGVAVTNTWNDNLQSIIVLLVTDEYGADDIDTCLVDVFNVPPTITPPLSGPTDPVEVNTVVSMSGDFTDPGTEDTHTAEWNWGDSTTSTGTVDETSGSGSVEGTHTYDTPSVYTVTLTVTDDDGGSDTEIFQYVVVYDPEDGFVTGGGWIDSPAGAYVADPTLTGKANFGFVSRYKRGANAPTGSTEFQFHAGDLNFHSSSYEWLVIANFKAIYKGTGTINGEGNYGFILFAIDEKLTPSTDVDMFRIKIWDINDNDAVVYDNEIGEAEDADPTTSIAGGSIVIHKK